MRPPTYRGALLRAGVAILVLAALAAAAWIYACNWEPSRTDFPVQGVSVDSSTGDIDWGSLHASHADFAYIRASANASFRDPAFAANWAGARRVGLRYGAMHDFSLCAPAADQATMFVTTVPRDNAALPPVVHLTLHTDCKTRPSRDALLSSLNTFLNLIEAHSGKTALVRVSKDFNDIYDVGGGIYRTLWLDRNFLKPDYAGRPWVMWTASTIRRLDGVDAPVEWDVVAP
ncbi:MAG TPA: GH25 family lysozyme [Sphingobium sp.]